MTFPGAGAQVYYNEAGEPTGWVVTVREANYSAFNGGRRTPSAYSEVRCMICGRRWRTKAAYVKNLPDA